MKLKKINIFEKLINWIHDNSSEKQFLIFASILVGLSAGIAAVILKLFVYFIRNYLVEDYLLLFNYKYIYLLLPLVGIGFPFFFLNLLFKTPVIGVIFLFFFFFEKKSSFLPFQQIYSHIITSG